MLASMSPLLAGVDGAGRAVPARRRSGPGQTVRRPGVARALEAVVRSGRDGFYGGEFGEGLLELGAGEYAPDDLARPLADWVTPLGRRVWGADVWTIPPASQGYLTLASSLIAEGLDAARTGRGSRCGPICWPRAVARPAGTVPTGSTPAPTPTSCSTPTSSTGGEPRSGPTRCRRSPIPPTDGGTIHLAAVDRDRMAVSLIQSNASGFGSHLFEPRTGINLHNRGLGFSLAPGHPAELRPRSPPAPHPGARTGHRTPTARSAPCSVRWAATPNPRSWCSCWPASSASASRRHGPCSRLASCSPATPRAAASTPGTTRTVIGLDIEADAEGWWRAGLEARGHSVRVVPAANHGMGHAHLIAVDDDHLAGASDWRAGAGAAAGY